MNSIEAKVLKTAALLMGGFFVALLFSVFGLGLDLPTCLYGPASFDKGQVIQQGEKDFEIHSIARMWKFEPEEIRLPVGARAKFLLASADVTHGFQISDTNVNLMAVPGAINSAKAKFDKPGVYRVICHEFCGTGHQNMMAKIIVGDVEPPKKAVLTQDTRDPEFIKRSEELMMKYACVGCHTTDGRPSVGPSFKSLYGKKEQFTDGTEALMDEALLNESILEPNKRIAKGFNPGMPAFPIPPEDLKTLIEFIKTLPQ